MIKKSIGIIDGMFPIDLDSRFEKLQFAFFAVGARYP